MSGHTQTEFQFDFVQGQVFLNAEKRGKTFVGDAVRVRLLEHIPGSVVSPATSPAEIILVLSQA